MPRKYTSSGKRSHKSKAAVARAASKIIANSAVRSMHFPQIGSAPLGSRGFYGDWNRPVGLGPELKSVDTGNTVSTTVTAGVFTLLNGIAAGTDIGQRIGRKIVMKSIMIRGQVRSLLTQDAPSGDLIRVWIIFDKQANGAASTVATLLDATGDVFSNNNLDNRDRYKVIMDKVFSLKANDYTASVLTQGENSVQAFKKYIKCSYETIYQNTAGGIADIASGSLYLLTMSQGASLSQITTKVRVRYVDA